MCNRTKCIYHGQHYAGVCDYLSKTGHSRLAMIAKELKKPTTSEEVMEIADGKQCPFYRKRGEDEKPLQAVLAEMQFRAQEKKTKTKKKFVPTVTNAEAKEIQKWYKHGLSDRYIAQKTNLPEYKARAWREKNKLPSNFQKRREFDEKRALQLYKKGMTDVEIAKEIGRSATTVYNWRNRAGLDGNRMTTRLVKEMQTLREELYREGASDQEIAEKTGTKIGTVRAWRQYHKLPANDTRKEVKYDRALMRAYYLQGMTDSQIAKKFGCYSTTIAKWRSQNNLPPNKARKKTDP